MKNYSNTIFFLAFLLFLPLVFVGIWLMPVKTFHFVMSLVMGLGLGYWLGSDTAKKGESWIVSFIGGAIFLLIALAGLFFAVMVVGGLLNKPGYDLPKSQLQPSVMASFIGYAVTNWVSFLIWTKISR